MMVPSAIRHRVLLVLVGINGFQPILVLAGLLIQLKHHTVVAHLNVLVVILPAANIGHHFLQAVMIASNQAVYI